MTYTCSMATSPSEIAERARLEWREALERIRQLRRGDLPRLDAVALIRAVREEDEEAGPPVH